MTDRPTPSPRASAGAALDGAWSSREALAGFVAGLLERELAHRRAKGLDESALRRYYGGILDEDGRPMPLAAYAYVQRLWPLIEVLKALPAPLRVLDAGCGYGTESYLMALMGHDVTGVELVPERAGVARSRQEFFAAQSEREIKVSFVTANVFGFLQQPARFDVIWLMEAISHIHPPEPFLELAGRALTGGGFLVVSDPNRRNPLAAWRSIRIRGSLAHRPHTRFRDPQTGLPVEYGQERIVSPQVLSRALERSGFSVLSVGMSGFMATTVLPRAVLRSALAQRLLRRLAGFAGRLPLLCGLGSIYTVVAAKRPGAR